MLKPATVICRVQGIHTARISDHELVVLAEDSDHYIGLDETAVAIWDRLDEPKSISDMIDSLVATFEGDRRAIEKDVMAFVELLLDEGLAQIHG